MLAKAPVPFRIALTMAAKSEYRPYKVGACIARGRRIISAGFNQNQKSHPLLQRLGNSLIMGLHAEMHSTIGCYPGSLVGADIYVVRLRRDGKLGLAKPCELCQTYLKERGIRRAHYTRTGEGFGLLKL